MAYFCCKSKRQMKYFLQILCAFGVLILAGCATQTPSRKDAMVAYQAGMLDRGTGANQAALADFSQAIMRDPSFVPAYLNRADVEIALTNVPGAMADWTAVIDLEPTNESALLFRGAARFRFKDFAGAASDYSRVIRLDSGNARLFVLRGACGYYLNDYAGASNDLDRALAITPNDVRAHDYRGRLRARQRDWVGAKADFSAAIEANPNDVMARQNRASVEMTTKDYEAAVDDASRVIQLDHGNLPGAHRLLARGKIYLKDNAGALAEADELVELDPSNAASYFARANIKTYCDDFSGASNDLKTAVLMDPANMVIYQCREALEQKCREPEAALADLGRMLALDSHSSQVPEIYEARGHVREELHQWRRALGDFHKAMAYNSPPNGACFEAFLLQCRLGEKPQAMKDLDAYIHSMPASKTNDWTASIANYLAGNLNENEFLAQATTTAKRPTDISSQLCDAYYFEGMEHLLAGDKAKAAELFQKSVSTGEDNSYSYMNAMTELDDLKNTTPVTTSQSPSNHGP
jgi:tetratricopeptide (TPR) repeat protein